MAIASLFSGLVGEVLGIAGNIVRGGMQAVGSILGRG